AGVCYSLQTAYENGWLSKVDLQNIAYYHNVPLYDPFGESLIKGFKPTPRTPEALSEETEKTIVEAGLKGREWLLVHLKEMKYYGTYDGFVAVLFDFNRHNDICEDIIGGVKFIYNDFEKIILWKE
ncbi:MAG: hypothetical protein K2M36_06055, partial [Clostridia bacterium]|nr:hypothetical protein [Clostridia bacterium]